MYPQAAAIANAPTAINHQEVCSARTNPATAAKKKEINAAFFTDFALARPVAVKRIGPIRESSVPRIPSE